MVLVEVLVTATVVAVGVLGLAQIQGRTAVAAVEAQQRTQALLLALSPLHNSALLVLAHCH